MTDDLRAMMMLYHKSKEGQAAAAAARVEAEAMLREARTDEQRHKSLLESIQPLVHKMEGGPAALQAADQEIAAGQSKAEGKAPATAEGKAPATAEGKAPATPATAKSKPPAVPEGGVTFQRG